MTILGYILLGVTMAGLVILSYAIVHSNHVKCPYCGEDMQYVGNDETFNQNKGNEPDFLQHHYYKCPYCGKTVIL